MSQNKIFKNEAIAQQLYLVQLDINWRLSYKFILLNGMEPSRVMTLASRGSDQLFLMFSRRANLKSDKNMPHTQYGMKLDEKCIPAGGGTAALENGPR